VSSALTTLEGRHGVALFDRIGRTIVLNPAGEIFLAEARAVLARAAAAEAALADLGNLARGKLFIHASQTIASYWLPPRLVRFHKAYPGIALGVCIGNTAEVARAVADGASELGLVEGEIDDPALSRIVIDHDRLSLVVGRDHPWATDDGQGARDLTQSAWVIREAGSGTRSCFETMLAKLGLALRDLDIAMVLPGNEAVRGAVEAGAGAAVLSRSAVASGLVSGRLVEIPQDIPARAFHLLRHKQRYRSRAADAFIDVCGKPA
jgi:DNA-binding transcriptional LysR family regulator